MAGSKVVQLVDKDGENIYPVGINGLSENVDWFTVILEGNQKQTFTSKNGNVYEFTPWDGQFGDDLASGWYLSSASDRLLFAEVTSQLETLGSNDAAAPGIYIIGGDKNATATYYNRNLGRRTFSGNWIAPSDISVASTGLNTPFRTLDGRRVWPGTYALSYSVLPGWQATGGMKPWIMQGKLTGLLYDGTTPKMCTENFVCELRSSLFMPAISIGLSSSQKKASSRTTYKILERKNV